MVATSPTVRTTRQTYTVAEMAVIYGIAKSTAQRLASRDEFPVPRLKLGGRIVYRRADVWTDLGLTSDPLAPEAQHEG